MASELTDIDVVEVSLVGSAANKRKYLLLKNEGGEVVEEKSENEIKGVLKFLYKLLGKKMPEDMMPIDEPKPKEEPCKEDKVAETKKSEVDTKLEVIEKERNNLKEQVEKDAKEKAELAKRVTELEKADRTRKLTEIAKSIDGAYEDNLKYLESLSESLPVEKFDMVVKREKAMAEKIANSKLFTESGSARPVPSGAFAKLDSLAKEKVAKSGGKITYPQAIDEASKENPELYAEYNKETVKREG